MSEFFDSTMVQEELQEITDLQRLIYEDASRFHVMDREDKMEHIDNLTELLDKQRVMYTRICLSDDPEAKKMKSNLVKSVSVMGFPPGTDVQVLFTSMSNTIQALKSQVDI